MFRSVFRKANVIPARAGGTRRNIRDGYILHGTTTVTLATAIYPGLCLTNPDEGIRAFKGSGADPLIRLPVLQFVLQIQQVSKFDLYFPAFPV
jgi:hypothetical protein